MNLKGRLKTIADKVPICDVVADIGTDHAYLPIYLVKQGICQKAIASDVMIGPIKVANKNITQKKLSDKIETRLGSGLDTISEKEAQVVVIAGMGGLLLAELLEDNVPKVLATETLILQPMNYLEVVRKWLYDHKYDIYDEELVKDGNKTYCVLAATYSGKVTNYNNFQLHVGDKLIEKKDPLLLNYCELKVKHFNRVLGQLKLMEDNQALIECYSTLKKDYLSLIDKIKEEWLD